MTRLDLLQLVVTRARAHGFEFRRWYITRLSLPWISADAAVRLLEQQRRYYALVFSHEFACTFWKPGEDLTFEVPAQSFERVMPDGTVRSIQRKAFIRRSARPEAWRYHLREMALAEEPLRYLRKYLHIEEQLDPEVFADTDSHLNPEPKTPSPTLSKPLASKQRFAAKGVAQGRTTANGRLHPLLKTPPAFLSRPYPAIGKD